MMDTKAYTMIIAPFALVIVIAAWLITRMIKEKNKKFMENKVKYDKI